MLIREVILKNFMSYEYARIPLKGGVNIVTGPNGSGKSSLLLGICVALGDTYTERSKRLSDLIRWGEDLAEVSLTLDNRKGKRGYRPVPRFDMDEVRLTRYLRKDGKYWFELNQRNVTKTEVVDILRTFGFDPSNMLIIMHQAMPTRFASMNPEERLKILEQAVGFDTFRREVLEAKEKLRGVLSEEESLNNLLEQARETLGHWREQNEKLQRKKQLKRRMRFLKRERAWSEVMALEERVRELEEELERAQEELSEAEEEMERYTSKVTGSESDLKRLRDDWFNLIERRGEKERLLGESEQGIILAKDHLGHIERLINNSKEQEQRIEITTRMLKERLKEGPTTLDDYFDLVSDLEEKQHSAYQSLREDLLEQRSSYEARLNHLSDQLIETEGEVQVVNREMEALLNSIDDANDEYVDSRINIALIRDRRGRLRGRIQELEGEMDEARLELKDAEAEALVLGQRVDTGRDGEEILSEMRQISGKLMGLSEVPENAEEMYERYKETFEEIKDKVEQVKENRRKIMQEIQERRRKWQEVMRDLLDEVNARYSTLLAKLNAKGGVKLLNPGDIEEAGLEIYVGFKGAQQSRLDPYTHSGGERSTSVMAFLLALQQNILSPFRAVDEFDLHMDPKNKVVVSDFIVETMEDTEDQYMAITPSQVTFQEKDVHIIMVQKTDDVSSVRLVEEN
ncbi:MAG: AAA family ATPase [Candidatus Bathyarchaeia archaeon]